MKIIILSLTQYKEKDSIVNAISEDEYLTFNAHGILSPSSRNAAINNVLTVADVVLTTSKSNKYSLKECSVIESPFVFNNDFNLLVAMNIIAEATNKMLEDQEKHLAFNYLDRAIKALKHTKNPLLIAIAYLCKLSNLAGYSIEINRCVRCGSKKNIVAFSFEEGGYICKDCILEEDRRDLTVEQMLLIRDLASTFDFDFNHIEHDDDRDKFLLDKFLKFINEVGGVHLSSCELIIYN